MLPPPDESLKRLTSKANGCPSVNGMVNVPFPDDGPKLPLHDGDAGADWVQLAVDEPSVRLAVKFETMPKMLKDSVTTASPALTGPLV
ncbi:MAG: hypothetical protein JO051_01560 [Acidobacteriaceae bacterium]|nr:hypothetical protein [Acidobacteriaceae bacterium]